MIVLSWVFGIGAMTSLVVMNQQKSRGGMLAGKLSADIFWIAHYFCLGAVGGMIPNFVGIFRECVYMNRHKRKWASVVLWPILFVTVNFALGLRTFVSPINILPIAASACATVALWLEKPNLSKIVLSFVSASFLIYDIFVGSYIGILNETFGITSMIIYFIREAIQKRREKNEKGVQ